METQLVKVDTKPQLKAIPIEKLMADPKQPRKTRNTQKDDELCQSIKSEGVLQSLLVRPYEGKFMIVCGHRRYDASLKAGITEVPAIVREMSDQRALIIQHIENIQRDDVNAMEQAKGFKMLIAAKEMTAVDIAIRIGKSEYFVKQQLTLNDLTEKWQHMFYLNAMSISHALEIATLPTSAQDELYKTFVNKEDENSSNPHLSINSHQIQRYKGFLNKAPFDVNDPGLDPKVGACISCPFNTACTSLFPGEAANPRCNNMACYNRKIDLNLSREIEIVVNDPCLVFLYEGYGESKIMAKLEKDGHKVLKCGYSDDCTIVLMPERPLEHEYIKNARKKNKKVTAKQAKVIYEKVLKDYEEKVAFVNQKVQDGIYKKGLMVFSQNSLNTGRYFIVQLVEKVSKKKAVVIDLNDDNVKPAVIQDEIERINNWYAQSLKSDEKAVQKKIASAFKEYKHANQVPLKPLNCLSSLTNGLLIEMLNYSTRDIARKAIKIPDLWHSDDRKKYSVALGKLTKQQVTFLVRLIVGERHANSLPNTNGGAMFRMMCEEMKEFPINTFEKEQSEKAKKRTLRKDERVDTLKKRKATLEKKKGASQKSQSTGKVQKLLTTKKAS